LAGRDVSEEEKAERVCHAAKIEEMRDSAVIVARDLSTPALRSKLSASQSLRIEIKTEGEDVVNGGDLL